MATISDSTQVHEVIGYEPTWPHIGVWHAVVNSTAETPLAGAVTLTDGDYEFVGFVVRSNVEQDRCKTKIVGGPGTLGMELSAKNYANGPQVRSILLDILAGVGATLSDTVPDTEEHLERFIPRWQRTKAPASREITALLDEAGATWRVLDDGTIWVGALEFPEVEVVGEIVDQDFSDGVIEIATETPFYRPLTTVLGHPIKYVEYSSNDQRALLYLEAPGELFDKMLETERREAKLARMFSATVTGQNADGTLKVQPDDATIAGEGLNAVELKTSAPGRKIVVPNGSRVRVAFDNGDPKIAMAALFDQDGSANEALLLGTTFNTYNKVHAHSGPLGPSGPPIAYPADSLLLSTREFIAPN